MTPLPQPYAPQLRALARRARARGRARLARALWAAAELAEEDDRRLAVLPAAVHDGPPATYG